MSNAKFEMDTKEIERLHEAMRTFPQSAEGIINSIFHEDGVELVTEEIYRLMPRSGKKWKGKPKAAKDATSLISKTDNLSFTVTTAKKYNYLYFPDDGSSTQNHVGNQHFFRRGGENKQTEIINRCIYMVRRRLGEF